MTAAIVDPASTLRLRRLLGYAGLLPFVGCLAVMLMADRQGWRDEAAIQLLYL